MKTIDSSTDQCRVDELGSSSKASFVKEYKAVAPVPNLVYETLICTSSESSMDESYKDADSHQTRHSTCNRACQNRKNKLS